MCYPDNGVKTRKKRRRKITGTQSGTITTPAQFSYTPAYAIPSLNATYAIPSLPNTYAIPSLPSPYGNPNLPATYAIPSIQATMERQALEQETEPIQLKPLTEPVDSPFPPSSRRPQRKFTLKEDENLLIGFQKYGAAWYKLRDDPELGFKSRHPTDLRDRFRLRYPARYAKAGFKPKKDRLVYECSSDLFKPLPRDDSDSSPAPPPRRRRRESPPAEKTLRDRQDRRYFTVPTTSSATPGSGVKSHGRVPSFFDSSPLLLNDDAVSDDRDGNEGPITLNRNILQWAGANPSTLSAFPPPPTSTYTPNHTAGDTSLNLFPAHDGIHINPLATLKLPPTLYTNPIAPSYTNTVSTTNPHTGPSPSSFHLQAPGLPDIPFISTSTSTSNPPADPRTVLTSATIPGTTIPGPNIPSLMPSASASTALSSSLVLTPNLPTIVFPHVPAASARSTMHKLPTPADLLLGVDSENRESQNLGISFDDALNLSMALNSS